MMVPLLRIGLLLLAFGAGGCTMPRPQLPLAGEGLEAYYARVGGVERTPVSHPRFADGGEEIRQAMLELIADARDHILLDSFLLTDGPASREVLDALADQAARGVSVYAIGDASSRYVMEPEAFEYLESRGVATAEFHPIKGWRLLAPPVLLERDHRKFWVVDGRHVLFGGANLSELSLIPAAQGGNRDLMVRVESPEAAAQLTRSFLQTWQESESRHEIDGASLPATPAPSPELKGYWIFNQDELHRPTPTAVMLEGLYAAAREQIWLIEPYTFTHPGILAGIREMAQRGVEVNVVLSTQVRAPRFRYASYYGILDLIRAGARVWVFDSTVSPLHYKCALVDDRLAYLGSANLNYRSLKLSRELSAVFDDADSVAAVRKVVESVRRDSREVKIEEARRYRDLPFALWWLVMQTAG